MQLWREKRSISLSLKLWWNGTIIFLNDVLDDIIEPTMHHKAAPLIGLSILCAIVYHASLHFLEHY